MTNNSSVEKKRKSSDRSDKKSKKEAKGDEGKDAISKNPASTISCSEKSIKPIESFSHVTGPLEELVKSFSTPTPIQQWAMSAISFQNGTQDVIGIAETGSGKTIAFGLPILTNILGDQRDLADGNKKSKKAKGTKFSLPKMLVLAPTRELALQTATVLSKVVPTVCIYGGASKHDQRRQLREEHPLVIVGTPGRIIDFLEEADANLADPNNSRIPALCFDKISHLVLDEADRMLDMGFAVEIEKIIRRLPVDRQTVMFSATWPLSIQTLAMKHLRANPIKIVIGRSESTQNADEAQASESSGRLQVSSTVTQHVHVVKDFRDKDQKLLELLRLQANQKRDPSSEINRVIVFALYKKEAARLAPFLQRNGYKVGSLHGDMAQSDRTRALEEFRSGRIPMLVATDVAARGLDIPDVQAVFNYTFPLTIEDYVHRVGRTGRAGRHGVAHTLFSDLDKQHAGELINLLKGAGVTPPDDLLAYGCTTKKKVHKEYGAFFKEIDPSVRSSHVKFDADSDAE